MSSFRFKFLTVYTSRFVLFKYTNNQLINPLIIPPCNLPQPVTYYDSVYLFKENTLIYLPDNKIGTKNIIPTKTVILPFIDNVNIERAFLNATIKYIEDVFNCKIAEIISLD